MKSNAAPYFEIRSSAMHGSGAFALRHIPARTRLIEYTGERISHEEADSRPDVEDGTGGTHVLLFTVDSKTVIDARVGGNEAQYFNHSCDGNCEAVVTDRRVFLETVRDVAEGEELTYDYEMEYSGEDLETARRNYPCRCGSPHCRGTLLDMPRSAVRGNMRSVSTKGRKGSSTSPSRKRSSAQKQKPAARKRPVKKAAGRRPASRAAKGRP